MCACIFNIKLYVLISITDDYILTKRTTSSNSTGSVVFERISVNLQQYSRDQGLSLISGLPVTLVITVSAPTCNQELRVSVAAYSNSVTLRCIKTEDL